MGVFDIEEFSKIEPRKKKEKLCYCNFSINTHKDRINCFDKIKDKKFIDFEHIGDWGNYPLTQGEYYEKLNDYKFSICPRGAGWDSYRIWESIYLGVIPIIERNPWVENWEGLLPILIVDDWKDINKEFLKKEYSRIKKSKYDSNILDFNYWKELIIN